MNALLVITYRISATKQKELQWEEIEKEKRRWSGWFARTADKEKDNYRGSKHLFSAFCWELFLLHVPPSP